MVHLKSVRPTRHIRSLCWLHIPRTIAHLPPHHADTTAHHSPRCNAVAVTCVVTCCDRAARGAAARNRPGFAAAAERSRTARGAPAATCTRRAALRSGAALLALEGAPCKGARSYFSPGLPKPQVARYAAPLCRRRRLLSTVTACAGTTREPQKAPERAASPKGRGDTTSNNNGGAPTMRPGPFALHRIVTTECMPAAQPPGRAPRALPPA